MENLNEVYCELLNNKAHKVVKYLERNKIIRATRRLYQGKIRSGSLEILLTMGKPNFEERNFIKKCIRAKKVFIGEIQIKYPPRKRK